MSDCERRLAELRREYQHSQNAHELVLNQRDEARRALDVALAVVRAAVAEHLALYDQSVEWTVYHKHRLAKEAAVDALRADPLGALMLGHPGDVDRRSNDHGGNTANGSGIR